MSDPAVFLLCCIIAALWFVVGFLVGRDMTRARPALPERHSDYDPTSPSEGRRAG